MFVIIFWHEGDKETQLLNELIYLDNGQKAAKRDRIKQTAGRIRDIVIKIIDQISSTEIKRSMDVIQQSFQNSFKQIDKTRLEQFILKSMAHAKQIRQILCSEYGLEVIFGKRANAQNGDFVINVIGNTHPDEEDYENVFKIFEDEEDTRPVSTKTGFYLSEPLPPPPLPHACVYFFFFGLKFYTSNPIYSR